MEDLAYMFYYPNPSSTFAPAVMVNRKADQDISSAPVIEIDNKNLKTLITKAAESKPYVSLNLDTKFDEAKRELKVKLQIKPHEQITADSVLFNVFLTQDNIQGPQSMVALNIFTTMCSVELLLAIAGVSYSQT